MHSTIFTVFALAATGALAGPFNPFAKRATCAAVDVEFHYNDTTIGVTQSCTTDVMYRGGSLPTRRWKPTNLQKYKRGYYAAEVPACVDGPTTNYTVVSGDTLEKIAADFNSGVCNIAELNSLDNPDFILVDQVLQIPTNVCTADNDSCRTEEGTATCVPTDAGVESTYTIESGDTFFLIASELGITLDSLVAANPDVDAGALEVGQVIDIPICTE